MCLLPLTTDEKVDLSGWSAQGMRSTATGSIDLSGTMISADSIIGAAGDFMQQPYFSGGAWRFCAVHLRRLSLEGIDADNVVAFANLTRMVTERSALDVMETVQRGVGLASFIRPHPIERISRDLATYLRQPVPDLAMSDGARAFLVSGIPVGEF
jgi:hypothetical protein